MKRSIHVTKIRNGIYTVLLLVKHKRSNSPTSIGMITSLAMNSNGSLANTKLVLGAGNGARRGRYLVAVVEVEITEVVDGEQPANGVPYIPSQLGQ